MGGNCIFGFGKGFLRRATSHHSRAFMLVCDWAFWLGKEGNT